jgi:hypothetical protein
MNAPVSTAADARALAFWGAHRAQKKRCVECDEQEASPASLKDSDTAYATLFAIEKAFEADIGASVLTLGAVLMVEIERDEPENVPGLNRAALAAIRPSWLAPSPRTPIAC